MKNFEHQITITEAVNEIEAKQMTDEELNLFEKAIKEVKKKRGIGTRYGGDEKYKAGRDDYMTPPDIYEPLLKLFGRDKFDIDVCCTKENIPANIHYTKTENGLHQKWCGLCFFRHGIKLRIGLKKGFRNQTIRIHIFVLLFLQTDSKSDICRIIS